MSRVQVLKDKKGRPTHAVVPWKEYQALTNGDAEDAALVKLGEAAAGEPTFPSSVMRRIVFDRENTVKVIREHRGMSQRELAARVKSTAAYISQIENGRPAGRAMLSKLSKALGVSIDLLVDD